MVVELFRRHLPDHLDAYDQALLASRCELAISRIRAGGDVPETERECFGRLNLILNKAHETSRCLIFPVITEREGEKFISFPGVTDEGLKWLMTVTEVLSSVKVLLSSDRSGSAIEKLRNSCSLLTGGNIPPAEDLEKLEGFIRDWGSFHYRINHPGCGHAGGW